MSLIGIYKSRDALRALQLYAPELRAQTGIEPPERGPSFGVVESKNGTLMVVSHKGDTWKLEAETWAGAAQEIRGIAIGTRPPLTPPAPPEPPKPSRKKRSRA